jgi:hypothetical protein
VQRRVGEAVSNDAAAEASVNVAVAGSLVLYRLARLV